MSEIGGIDKPFHRAFQLDRSRLEADLQRMNQEDGVELHLGSRVYNIQLSSDSTPHQFLVETEAKKWKGQSRWIIDADRTQRDYGVRVPGAEFPPAHGESHRHLCLEALALFKGGDLNG